MTSDSAIYIKFRIKLFSFWFRLFEEEMSSLCSSSQGCLIGMHAREEAPSMPSSCTNIFSRALSLKTSYCDHQATLCMLVFLLELQEEVAQIISRSRKIFIFFLEAIASLVVTFSLTQSLNQSVTFSQIREYIQSFQCNTIFITSYHNILYKKYHIIPYNTI